MAHSEPPGPQHKRGRQEAAGQASGPGEQQGSRWRQPPPRGDLSPPAGATGNLQFQLFLLPLPPPAPAPEPRPQAKPGPSTSDSAGDGDPLRDVRRRRLTTHHVGAGLRLVFPVLKGVRTPRAGVTRSQRVSHPSLGIPFREKLGYPGDKPGEGYSIQSVYIPRSF